MICINEVTLLGVVGKIDTRDAGSSRVTNITLATSDGGYTSRDGKDIPETTQWHNVKAWNNKFAETYIKKGSRIYVKGKLAYRTYEGNDGQKKYITEVNADQLILLDKQSDANRIDEDTARKLNSLRNI